MANTAGYVTTGKPNIGGSVWVAPKGTTLPTNATTALDTTKFTCLGYVSEDGLENNNEMDVSAIKAWGGNIVYRSLTELSDEFSLALIETAMSLLMVAAMLKLMLLQKIPLREYGYLSLHSGITHSTGS